MGKLKSKMFTISHNTLLVFANRVSVPLILAGVAWVVSGVADLKTQNNGIIARIEGNAKAIEGHETRIERLESHLMDKHAEIVQGDYHAVKSYPLQPDR